ncbi:MAG: cytochrome C [Rhodobacter sp.]|nr:cytochrome C [Paracoccaceae bacterium]MCC0076518.1 cytochrome C [Rhodobacter sp.]
MIKTAALSAVAALSLGLSATAAFAGDAHEGEEGFRQCRSCHSITADDGTVIQRGGRTGPNLYGLPGRAVASVEGFNYSDGLHALAATGATWTEDLFVEYTADPTAFLRAHLNDNSLRSAMNFRLRSGADNLWAYLQSVSQ